MRYIKSYVRNGKWYPVIGEYAPGHINDPANLRSGGFKRFMRWQRFPITAWRLYWRSQERRK